MIRTIRARTPRNAHFSRKENDMQEIWKDVVGYEGLYQVSNLGRIKSLPRQKSNTNGAFVYHGKVLTPMIDSRGYYFVRLFDKNHCARNRLLHRLVAQAFIPNPHNYPCINHKDENKKNPAADNLEWCTIKYNRNYGNAILKTKIKCKGINSKPVLQYSLSGDFIKSFPSMTIACQEIGVSDGCAGIVKSCKSKNLYAYGYYWRYKRSEIFPNHIDVQPYIVRHIIQSTMDGIPVAEFNSIKEASRKTGFSETNIGRCVHGNVKTANNYIWSYK